MELLNAIVTTVNGVVWGWPMIILLLGTHIYMTAKTGFIQRFTITKGIRLSVEKIRRNIFIIWMQKMTHRYR